MWFDHDACPEPCHTFRRHALFQVNRKKQNGLPSQKHCRGRSVRAIENGEVTLLTRAPQVERLGLETNCGKIRCTVFRQMIIDAVRVDDCRHAKLSQMLDEFG